MFNGWSGIIIYACAALSSYVRARNCGLKEGAHCTNHSILISSSRPGKSKLVYSSINCHIDNERFSAGHSGYAWYIISAHWF